MNELEIFKNSEFGTVRAQEIDNEPWFAGSDVATALGYSNSRDAIATHVDVEDRRIGKLTQASENATPNRPLTLINESGLYSLVFASTLPNAKKFKHWITSEVLPAIRKHGIYATENVAEQIINNPDFGIKVLTALQEERSKTKELTTANQLLTEEKNALETELDRDKEWYSIKRVAMINGVSPDDFHWRPLKIYSGIVGKEIKKVFDSNYTNVNAYHRSVWQHCYPEADLD